MGKCSVEGCENRVGVKTHLLCGMHANLVAVEMFAKMVGVAAKHAMQRPGLREEDQNRLQWAIEEFHNRADKLRRPRDYALAEAVFWIGIYAGDLASVVRKAGKIGRKPAPEWWAKAREIRAEMKTQQPKRSVVVNYVLGQITKKAEEGIWPWPIPDPKTLRNALYPKPVKASLSEEERDRLALAAIDGVTPSSVGRVIQSRPSVT